MIKNIPCYQSPDEDSLQKIIFRVNSNREQLIYSIADNESKIKTLNAEIRNLIDLLEILEDPIASDSLSGDEIYNFKGKEWFRDDDEFSEIDRRRDVEKLADLKARLVLKRKDLHEGFGRVSISKPKSKIYKSNLKRIDDKFNFPIVLGRGVYKTFILKIGHIISGDQFRKDPFFYPVDFKSRRRYYKFDCDDEKFEKGEKIYYQCCIKTNEQNIPVFEISSGAYTSGMDNDEEKKRQDPPVSFIDQDVNIDELWSRFQNMFSSLGRLKLAGDFSGPEIFFGLGHDSVMKHLRQLSNDISISI